MKNKSKIIAVSFVCFFVFVSSLTNAETLLSINEGLKNAFPNATDFKRNAVTLSEAQRQDIEKKADISFETHPLENVVLFTALMDDKILGYAFEDTVNGKWGPIHYLLILDPEGKIMNVHVLDFKEKRGRPAAKKSFTNQFIGKNITNPLRLRRDINGVTGATITSTSLTDGIRKLLYLFEEIKKM